MEKQYRSILAILILPVLLTIACNPGESPPGSGTIDACSKTDAGVDGVPTQGTGPLGSTCVSGAECASGFCVDGVCCDGACSDQCYGCKQPGSHGTCAPLSQGEDALATVPCVGAKRCVLDATGIPACRAEDRAVCSASADCASGLCRTFFSDADGDGFGVASSHLSICASATAVPPSGYSVLAGDCCDSDTRANPGIGTSAYFLVPNGCGSFDWNCNGVVERQNLATCPGAGGASVTVACGTTCYAHLLGSTLKLFTQQCR